MQHIPVPVVERLAVFADDKSLVLFASCSQWLWQCVGIQQRVWRQRYIQHYTFKDDDEVQWLSWYVRTLRVSGALAATSNTAIDVTQLNDHDINWFLEDTSDSDQGNQNTNNLALRKVCCDGFDPTVNVEQFLVSDKFVVIVIKKTNKASNAVGTPYNVLIWPVHRVSTIQPYSVPYLCNRKSSIRGRWLLLNYIERSLNRKLAPLSTTRVFDMATRQICMGSIQNSKGTSFIQRATEDTATVFYAYIDRVDTFQTVHWSVWQFSVCQLEDNPQCLMQGEFTITCLAVLQCPVERLDDERVLVAKHVMGGFNESANEVNSEVLSLAVILTNCDNSNQSMDNQKPIWSHYIKIREHPKIIDLIQPTNSKRLGIVDAELLAVASVKSNTTNALVMHSKDGYKIVDVSC
ncbi:hypothetical protein BDF19DRAFT_466518 [Syncephalis fuscata]|nr:hypothetical protein BDF19DRAFT_466518 [Syncephalis fuscata]